VDKILAQAKQIWVLTLFMTLLLQNQMKMKII